MKPRTILITCDWREALAAVEGQPFRLIEPLSCGPLTDDGGTTVDYAVVELTESDTSGRGLKTEELSYERSE